MNVKLTPEEKQAAERFLEAAKALPNSLYIFFDAFDDDGVRLCVCKRTGPGSGQEMVSLKKKSLQF